MSIKTASGRETAILLMVVCAVGCAQVQKQTATDSPPQLIVTVSPESSSVQTRALQRFTASVQNDSQNKGVTWSLTQSNNPCSPACGSISSSGMQAVYTAPSSVPSPSSATLIATSIADNTKSASAQITLTPPQNPLPISVSLLPTAASLLTTQSQQFAASVLNDSQNKGVTWSLTQSGVVCSPKCGTLSNAGTSQGTYLAPTTAPNPSLVTLTATSIADTTKSASGAVTVNPAASTGVSVSVLPQSAPVLSSKDEQFNASIQNDTHGQGVTWSLTQFGLPCSPTCGSIIGSTTVSAMYGAPSTVPSPAAVTLTATSILDNTKSASATITIASLLSSGNSSGPWIDVSAYGVRAFHYPIQNETCSILAGSPTLTCSGPLDWINGDGIRVDKAGALTNLATPSGITVTPVGVLNGSTTYNYRIVAEDYNGSLTAASLPGSTSSGALTLGVNTVNLVSCTLSSSGITTYVTSVPHSFGVGAMVYISGNTDNNRCNGVVTIASTPSSTTFTSANYDFYFAPTTGTGGTAQVVAGNMLTWDTFQLMQQGATIRFWIYRNDALVGVAQGNDSFFVDDNYDPPSAPSYVPTTPPGVITPGWLSTVITSGAGSPTLTLADAAISTAQAQLAFHDNGPGLLSATNAAIASGGGVVFFPSAGDSETAYPFTTNLVFPPTSSYIKFLIAGGLMLNESWILNSGYDFEGEPGSGSFSQLAPFGTSSYAVISGSAYPMVYAMCRSGIRFKDLFLINNQSQQWALLIDGNSSCGSTGIQYEDFYAGGGGPGNIAEVIRGGGFDHTFIRGGLISGSGGPFAAEALQVLSSQNQGNTGILTYIVSFDGTKFTGKPVKIDNTPGGGWAGCANNYTFKNVLYEGMDGPLVRVNIANNKFSTNWIFQDVGIADPVVGFATPMIDLFNTTNLQDVSVQNVNMPSGYDPIFAAPVAPGLAASLSSVGTMNIGLAGNNYTLLTSIPSGGSQWVSAIPLSMKEQSAPAGAVGQDVLWADSATHTLKFNPNDEGAETIATTSDIDATWYGSLTVPLTSANISSTWTPDKSITITRLQVQVLTAPVSCSTNAVVNVTDGTTPEAITILAAANDSGPIGQNYSQGTPLTVGIGIPATGCATPPAQANVVVQYHLQ